MTDQPPAEHPPAEHLAALVDHEEDEAEKELQSRSRVIRKIVFRVAIMVVALVISTLVLFNIFDDLDFEAIGEAIDELSDAEWMSLIFAWLIWIGAQGLQTASLVHHLPARRGVLAFLGPAAVASVIPGPSDLPVRFSMYQSWGVSRDEAATAVAASGVFSISSRLALPALAGVLIFFGDLDISGFLSIIVATTLALAVIIVVVAFVLGSDKRTRKAGTALQPWLNRVRKILRKPPFEGDLGETLATYRAETVAYLSDKWMATTAATALTFVAKWSLLLITLRFVGIPEDALGWAAIAAVFALVQGITMLPITPGSVGVAEVALIGMLTPIAGSEYVNEVAAGVLLYRMATWLLLIPAGMIALGGWKINQRKLDQRAAEAAATEGA